MEAFEWISFHSNGLLEWKKRTKKEKYYCNMFIQVYYNVEHFL